jgi:hypothetical protein
MKLVVDQIKSKCKGEREREREKMIWWETDEFDMMSSV